jgi:ribonuclease Z
MGLIPLLRSAMYNGDTDASYSRVRMHIYGPPGIRSFVRFNLNITEATLVGKYAVHELLKGDEQPSASCSEDQLHESEQPGTDFIADEDGLWRNILTEGDWSVDAGQIVHRSTSDPRWLYDSGLHIYSSLSRICFQGKVIL